MKNSVPTLALFLVAISGFSQDFKFQVRQVHDNIIIKEKLQEAKLMKELIPYYMGPALLTYVSTEIQSTNHGKTMIATGTTDTLTPEQKSILAGADLGTDLVINIKFRYNKNIMPDVTSVDSLQHITNVAPAIESEYPTGYFRMSEYIKENAISKISESDSKNIPFAIVRFTIDENGEVVNPKVQVTTQNAEVDQLLLDAIKNMPKWKPAEDAKGNKVKQDFDLIVGTDIKNSGC